MACNAETLSVSSGALLGIPENLRLLAVINLLATIAGVPPNPQALSVSASALLGIPENLRWQVIIYLLCQIRDNGGGGGGGGGSILGTFANPNNNVTGAPGAFYTDTNLQTFWVQESASTSNTGWEQLV